MNGRAPTDEPRDEFYTRMEDIEYELKNYKEHFRGQRIYCPCDDARWSNFWWYFFCNFDHLGLKSLDATCFHKDQSGEHWHYEGGCPNDITREAVYQKNRALVFPYCGYEVLNNDGGFQYQTELIKNIDIVVTNPPFSLFRDFVTFVLSNDKKIVTIGNMNLATKKTIFPLFKENKLWFGINPVKEFLKPDGETQKFGNINWYTNLDLKKNHRITEYYSTQEYLKLPMYDNYDAINVDKMKFVPCDWTGWMGVPITFLLDYCPKQFEIKEVLSTGKVNGKNIYDRVVIRWKPEAMPTINEKGVVIY